MELRVVLYAEGAGETGGVATLLPAPGEPLDDLHLGPAHILVERCLLTDIYDHDVKVRFVAPLRIPVGARLARGSDLLDRTKLRRLVAPFRPGRDPDLAIVLVDSDGDLQRRTLLVRNMAMPADAHRLRSVVGAAHQAFEAWLLGDHTALKHIAAAAGSLPSTPDELTAAEAKLELAKILRFAPQRADASSKPEVELRRELARIVDLQQLRRQRSFEEFWKECSHAARALAARRAG